MALLYYSFDDDPVQWERELKRRVPDLDFRLWPAIGNPADITAALVWLPPAGLLASLPNLKAILSLAAGVDKMLVDPTLPDVPLCRLVDPSLTTTMSEYVLTNVLRYHRFMDIYEQQQRARVWKLLLPAPAEATKVGIMGMGVLGSDAASLLARHDFTVRGWSRTPKRQAGVETHHGADGLGAFLADLDILVCLLPLTAETEGVLSAGLFSRMKRGARIINVGRGKHLVEADLLAALESGRIAHATLDVFATEPLPSDNPLWSHPGVTVTPHAASFSQPKSGAEVVAENLNRLARGQSLLHVVDAKRGY